MGGGQNGGNVYMSAEVRPLSGAQIKKDSRIGNYEKESADPFGVSGRVVFFCYLSAPPIVLPMGIWRDALEGARGTRGGSSEVRHLLLETRGALGSSIHHAFSPVRA